MKNLLVPEDIIGPQISSRLQFAKNKPVLNSKLLSRCLSTPLSRCLSTPLFRCLSTPLSRCLSTPLSRCLSTPLQQVKKTDNFWASMRFFSVKFSQIKLYIFCFKKISNKLPTDVTYSNGTFMFRRNSQIQPTFFCFNVAEENHKISTGTL